MDLDEVFRALSDPSRRRLLDRLNQRNGQTLLRKALEATAMDKPEFVYTTYIRTTPEQLWRGLTDPSFTRRYWGLALETDWAAGSDYTVQLTRDDVKIADPAQVILESDPYRRLAYTWHTFTPEWAAAYGISDEDRARFAAEPRSKVAFDIEPLGDYVRLTVVHDGFEAGSAVLSGISQGWPLIVSSLKSLLETGEVLPAR
jgi:uncharacterized protein YndB with AHSA1/START domain